MTRVRSAAWLWLALAGCVTPAPPSPKPPGPAPHVSCVKACDHILIDLACPGSGDCNDVCVRVGDQAFTDCIGSVPDCAAVDRCDIGN